jgi:SAM-dependent methyltransferase
MARTNETYRRLFGDWLAKDYHKHTWARFRDGLLRLAGLGRILEVGFGSAPDAQYLKQLFGRYTGIDLCEEFVEACKENFPGLDLQVLDLFALHKKFKRGMFRAFWCAAVLLHIPPTLIDEALANLNYVTMLGGYGFISVKIGVDEGIRIEDSDGGEYERYFKFWQPDEFFPVLKRNGFEVVWHDDEYQDPQAEGVTWLVVYVRKVAETTFKFND